MVCDCGVAIKYLKRFNKELKERTKVQTADNYSKQLDVQTQTLSHCTEKNISFHYFVNLYILKNIDASVALFYLVLECTLSRFHTLLFTLVNLCADLKVYF